MAVVQAELRLMDAALDKEYLGVEGNVGFLKVCVVLTGFLWWRSTPAPPPPQWGGGGARPPRATSPQPGFPQPGFP
jgi:hypothetical protein